MESTVVLAGIPVRLSLRSPAYAACFQPFWTEADPVAAVRVPEDALKEAAPHYEAGTTPEQVEYLELGPRVCDALLPYGRILFHGAAIVWRGDCLARTGVDLYRKQRNRENDAVYALEAVLRQRNKNSERR